MARESECLPRDYFISYLSDDLGAELLRELEQHEAGKQCDYVEFTSESLGSLDRESAPRPVYMELTPSNEDQKSRLHAFKASWEATKQYATENGVSLGVALQRRRNERNQAGS